MKSVRTAVSALALIVALVGVTIAPAYAAPARGGCAPAAKSAHSCCKTPIVKACCSDRSQPSNQSAPAQSRVQVNPAFSATPVALAVDLRPAVRRVAAEHATPRAGPVDLPTLFSTLLL